MSVGLVLEHRPDAFFIARQSTGCKSDILRYVLVEAFIPEFPVELSTKPLSVGLSGRQAVVDKIHPLLLVSAMRRKRACPQYTEVFLALSQTQWQPLLTVETFRPFISWGQGHSPRNFFGRPPWLLLDSFYFWVKWVANSKTRLSAWIFGCCRLVVI